MRRKFEVTCELNGDASRYEKVIIETNLEKKISKLAEEHFKKNGAFAVWMLSYKELKSDE